MNNVIIDIKSKIDQYEGECHTIDIMTEGEWFEKHGAIYLVYYESEISGMQGCKTMLKIQDQTITMTRFGETNSKMIFNVNDPMSSIYKTPYGDFDMSIFTEELNIDLDKEALSGTIHLSYKMILESLSRSDNSMSITIKRVEND